MSVVLYLSHRADEDRAVVAVRVDDDDGAWTPGAHVSIEAGNEIELTPDELEWLIEVAGPRALEQVRQIRGGA